MNSELREHQTAAMARLRQSIAAGRRRIVLQAPTGFGKTLLAATIVDGALAKNKRVLFCVPALSLIDQSVEAFWNEGLKDIAVIQGQHEMTNWARPVQIASVQTLARREIPRADVVVIDECFAAGTMIDVLGGRKPIEDIRPNEFIPHALGIGRVLGVSKKQKRTIKLRLSNGAEIRVTKDHPIFTNRGWIAAGSLEVGARLFSHEAMRALRSDNAAMDWENWESSGRSRLEREALLLGLLRQEAGKSDGQGKRAFENVGDATENRTQTPNPRGQREAFSGGAVGADRGIGRGLGSGICGADEDTQRDGISDLLQDRHSQSEVDDWYRGGRGVSLQPHQSGKGSEEDGAIGDVWVEDISDNKQTGEEPVYNLRVSGHPSYFAGGVLVHNCHRWFTFYEKWFMDPAWQAIPFIGLSATPWTRGLGKYYQELIVAATTAELIEKGFLSPFRVFAPSHPDLSEVRTVAGDYHEGDLGEVMGEQTLVADVVETWLRQGEGRSTLCFAVDRAHAKLLQAKFEAAGVPTGYIDAYTDRDERNAVLSKFREGFIRVICNVGCLTTGIDEDVRCIVLARPTKSEMLFVQIIGRGLRTADGKEDCLILDHSDTTLRLGFVTDIHHDKLDEGKTKPKQDMSDKVRLPKECPNCAYLKPPRVAVCPSCGHKSEVKSDIEFQDGELVELDPNKKQKAGHDDKQLWYSMLLGIQHERGYSPKWAVAQYKQKFGVWPRGLAEIPTEPSPQVRSYVQSRMIAWAKSKRRAEGSHAAQ